MFCSTQIWIFLVLLYICHCKNTDISEIEIEELQPKGTFVVNLRNLLPTLSKAKSYSIINDEISKHFRICNSTFNLYIEEPLDHRKLCTENKVCKCDRCILHLSIAISVESKISLEFIKILIVDIDNHRPLFPDSSLTVFVHENKRKQWIQLPEARDLDFVDSQNLVYYLNFSSDDDRTLFELDERNGVIGLNIRKPLDREKRAQHELWLSAVGRKLYGTAEILIVPQVSTDLNDENDNPPICNDIENEFTVSSVYCGFVGKISASDADAPGNPNSVLSYNFIDDNNAFLLNQSDGSLTISSPLGIMNSKLVRINILVKDSGWPQLFAKCAVTVNVVKAPLLAFTPSTQEVAIHQPDNRFYISRTLRKGGRIADVDIWLPYVIEDSGWTFECTEQSLELVKLSNNRMAINLLTNLNDMPTHLSFMISCYDPMNVMVRNDYSLHVHLISPLAFRVKYPTNGSVVKVTSLNLIDPGPAFKMNVVVHYVQNSWAETAEPVNYQVDVGDDHPILLKLVDSNVFIVNVWSPGQYQFQLSIVGNRSGFLYHRVIGSIDIDSDVFNEFAKTTKHKSISLASIQQRRHTTIQDQHTGESRSVVYFQIASLSCVILLILIFMVACYNGRFILHKCKKVATRQWSDGHTVADFYMNERNIKYFNSNADQNNEISAMRDKLGFYRIQSAKCGSESMQSMKFAKQFDNDKISMSSHRSDLSSRSSGFKSMISSPHRLIMAETINPRIFLSVDRAIPSSFSATLDDSKLFFHQSSFV